MLVLVADRHDLFRQGLITTLTEMQSTNIQVEETASYAGLVLLMNKFQFDLVIISANIMNKDDSQSLHSFRAAYQTIPVLAIIEATTTKAIEELRRIKFNGIIAKSASKEGYVNALKSLLLGGNHIPFPTNKRTFTNPFTNNSAFSGTLTRRQEEVLNLLADGKSNREIATLLSLSEGTVKVHITAIFKVLGVKNRTQAMLLAQEHKEDDTPG